MHLWIVLEVKHFKVQYHWKLERNKQMHKFFKEIDNTTSTITGTCSIYYRSVQELELYKSKLKSLNSIAIEINEKEYDRIRKDRKEMIK